MMVTFSAGQSNASVSVPIMDDDVIEMTEVFTGSLSAVTESVMIGADTADITIIDNDSECIMTLYSKRCCVYIFFVFNYMRNVSSRICYLAADFSILNEDESFLVTNPFFSDYVFIFMFVLCTLLFYPIFL